MLFTGSWIDRLWRQTSSLLFLVCSLIIPEVALTDRLWRLRKLKGWMATRYRVDCIGESAIISGQLLASRFLLWNLGFWCSVFMSFGEMLQWCTSQREWQCVIFLLLFAVHFWAPTFKWGISIANIADFQKPPEKISYPQQLGNARTSFFHSKSELFSVVVLCIISFTSLYFHLCLQL